MPLFVQRVHYYNCIAQVIYIPVHSIFILIICILGVQVCRSFVCQIKEVLHIGYRLS